MKINISDIKVEGNQVKAIGTTSERIFTMTEVGGRASEDINLLEITIDAKSIYNLVNLYTEIKKLR